MAIKKNGGEDFAPSESSATATSTKGTKSRTSNGRKPLTIAAIVVGGSEFIGGRVSAVGAVLGAALLSLVGVLLGVFAIPSLFTAAAMGLLLIVVMGLRRLTREAERA